MATKHTHAYALSMLRLCGRVEAGTLPDVKLRALHHWIADLVGQSAVVDYDPRALPNSASPRSGGFLISTSAKGQPAPAGPLASGRGEARPRVP